MQFKKFYICLILFLINIPLAISGLRCDLIKKLEDPLIKSNAKFWEGYAELSSKNQLNDKTLSDLLALHKAESKASESVSSLSPTLRTSTSKRAEKELAELPTKAMKKNFEEFMDIMNGEGLKEFYKNPGRWHLEHMKKYPEGNVFSVRLNKGYRVLFKYEKNELTIMEVNAKHIHAL